MWFLYSIPFLPVSPPFCLSWSGHSGSGSIFLLSLSTQLTIFIPECLPAQVPLWCLQRALCCFCWLTLQLPLSVLIQVLDALLSNKAVSMSNNFRTAWRSNLSIYFSLVTKYIDFQILQLNFLTNLNILFNSNLLGNTTCQVT